MSLGERTNIMNAVPLRRRSHHNNTMHLGERQTKINWGAMPITTNRLKERCCLVDLSRTSSEYGYVESKFLSTLPFTPIIKIQRIQNPLLYAQFSARKKVMMNISGTANQQRLFHGTNFSSSEKINNNGFDRSFAGRHGKTVFCS